jgi:hypothetical protein
VNWYRKAQEEDLLDDVVREFCFEDYKIRAKEEVMSEVTRIIAGIDESWWDKYAKNYFDSHLFATSPKDSNLENIADRIVGSAQICKVVRSWEWMKPLLEYDLDFFSILTSLTRKGVIRNQDSFEKVMEAYETLKTKYPDIMGYEGWSLETKILDILRDGDSDEGIRWGHG